MIIVIKYKEDFKKKNTFIYLPFLQMKCDPSIENLASVFEVSLSLKFVTNVSNEHFLAIAVANSSSHGVSKYLARRSISDTPFCNVKQ